MVKLEKLQQEQKIRQERMWQAYEKVIQVRENETEDNIYRREKAHLEWIADYLLESDCFLRNCIYDGANLKRPSQPGEFNSINAGYSFGFDIYPGIGSLSFPLYVMDIHEKGNKEIYQCPKCRVVYSLPREIDVDKLRKLKKGKPMIFCAKE